MFTILAIGVDASKYPVAVQTGGIKRMIMLVLIIACVFAVTALITWKAGADLVDRATGREHKIMQTINTIDPGKIRDKVRNGILSTVILIAVTILTQMFLPPLGPTTIKFRDIVNEYEIKSISLATTADKSVLTSNGDGIVVKDIKGGTYDAVWMPSSGNLTVRGTIQLNSGRVRIVANGGSSPALKKAHLDL
jgi:hypothetical protein